jgi:hypothetical protein
MGKKTLSLLEREKCLFREAAADEVDAGDVFEASDEIKRYIFFLATLPMFEKKKKVL